MKDVFEIAVCDDSSFDRFVISEMIDGYFKDKSFLYHVTESVSYTHLTLTTIYTV